MKRIATGIVVLLVVLAAGCSQVQKWPQRLGQGHRREIVLTAMDGEKTVPPNKAWIIEHVEGAPEDDDVRTSDLYVHGQLFSGPDGGMTIMGDFDLSFSRDLAAPLVILYNSRVRVGDSRERVVLVEVDCPDPDEQ